MKVDRRAVPFCPRCHDTPRVLCTRVTEDESGREHFGGRFYACQCGAFTQSLSGALNLTNEVAAAYDITVAAKTLGALEVVKAVSFVVRKKGAHS